MEHHQNFIIPAIRPGEKRRRMNKSISSSRNIHIDRQIRNTKTGPYAKLKLI